MRYLIHGVPERADNIANIMAAHAVSKMKDTELIFHIDGEHKGNLPSYIDSIDFMTRSNDISRHELIWHLQDDVVLLPNFWENTNRYGKMYEDSLYEGPYYIFCGFTSNADYIEGRGWKKSGEDVLPEAMFYSFPCIGIPLWISQAFVRWIKDGPHSNEENSWIAAKKFDDSLFRNFICKNWDKELLDGKVRIYNLPKCLVDHRDDLCGGSVVNPTANSMNRRARLK